MNILKTQANNHLSLKRGVHLDPYSEEGIKEDFFDKIYPTIKFRISC